MVQPIWRNEIQQLAEKVRKRDLESLKQVVPETLLNLDQTLNYRFVVDSTFLQILTEIRDGLNFETRIAELNSKLNDTTTNAFLVPKWLDKEITYYENKINTLTGENNSLDWQKTPLISITSDTLKTKAEKDNATMGIRAIDWEMQIKKSEIQTYKNNIQTAQTKKDQVEQEKKDLETFWNTYKPIIGKTVGAGTRKRLSDLIKIGEKFKINKLIPRQNYGIWEPTTTAAENLNPLFAPTLWTHSINYVVCNSQTGEPITKTWGEFETTTDSGQTIKVKWIQINGNTVEFNNIQVDPMTGLTFPINLRLAIRGRTQDPVTGMNLDHFKNLDITINQPNFDKTARQTEIKTYNNGSTGNIIQEALTKNKSIMVTNLEREAIFRALEKNDGPKFNKLSPEQKEHLYQELHKAYTTTVPTRATSLADMEKFDTFLTRITGDKHESNKPEFTKNASAYRDYIHNNLEEQIKKYFERSFDQVFSESLEGNTYLKTQLTKFLTDIEGKRNDDEENSGKTITKAVEDDINDKKNDKINDLMKKYKRRKIFGIEFGRQDVSYMRFFNGANHELKDQTVDIATNTNVEDLKNPEPVKYDLKTDIMGKNQMSVTITFPNKDKRYPRKEITLKQGEISTLSKKILNCKDIGDFKVRTHIVYNMLVSMVKIAAKKNLSLRYRDPTTKNQREIIMDDKNILLYERDDTKAKRKIKTLFDYESFVNTNTFHGKKDSTSLQTAIDGLMGHFNYAMNEYHEQYRTATKWTLLKTKVSANSFWTSPLKTIMNLRTIRTFDFSTNVASEDGKKNVEISFEKNVITLKMGDIELKGKNLGKMLEYRKNKVRVFDGVERNIVFAMYDELIKKLRENSKINRSNFAVRDTVTRNIYIMDEDGQLGIVSPEDTGDILNKKNAGIISKKNLDDADARGGRRICTAEETKEAFMNPCIMGQMIKVMNKRMRRL